MDGLMKREEYIERTDINKRIPRRDKNGWM